MWTSLLDALQLLPPRPLPPLPSPRRPPAQPSPAYRAAAGPDHGGALEAIYARLEALEARPRVDCPREAIRAIRGRLIDLEARVTALERRPVQAVAPSPVPTRPPPPSGPSDEVIAAIARIMAQPGAHGLGLSRAGLLALPSAAVLEMARQLDPRANADLDAVFGV